MHPTGRDGGGSGRSRRPSSVFALRCPARADSLRGFRIGIAAWLAALEWPEDDRDDVVLAASEAVSNAIDHAYSTVPTGEVGVVGRLHATAVGRQVVLLVRDWGHWRTPPQDPKYRGHGMTVMRECMGRLDVDRGPRGTTVTLTSPVVPLLAPTARPRSQPPLRRTPLSAGVTAPAVDRITGERRQRQAVLRRRSEQLWADAARIGGEAETTWERSHDIVATSTRLLDEIRRGRADRRNPAQAA